MNNFLTHWKSTTAGILSFLITTLTTISALLAGNDLSAGGGIATIHKSTEIVIGVNVGLALCRAWLGLITKDAGTVTAVTPANPVPHTELSTEIPIDPKAVVVAPASKNP